MTGFPALGWIGLACALAAVILFAVGLCQVADDDRWQREEGEVIEREERDEADRSAGERETAPWPECQPAAAAPSRDALGAPLNLGPFSCEPLMLPARRGDA